MVAADLASGDRAQQGSGSVVVGGVTSTPGDGNIEHRAKGASPTTTPKESRVAVDPAHILTIPEELAQHTLAQPPQRHQRRYRLVCDPG
jgi:hypothetical protein